MSVQSTKTTSKRKHTSSRTHVRQNKEIKRVIEADTSSGRTITREHEVSRADSVKDETAIEIKQTVDESISNLIEMDAEKLIHNSVASKARMERMTADLTHFRADHGSNVLEAPPTKDLVETSVNLYGCSPLGYWSWKDIVDSEAFIDVHDMPEVILVKTIASSVFKDVPHYVMKEHMDSVSIYKFDPIEEKATIILRTSDFETIVDLTHVDASTMLLLKDSMSRTNVLTQIKSYGSQIRYPEITFEGDSP